MFKKHFLTLTIEFKTFSCNYCNKNKSNTKSLRDLDLDFINYRQYKSLYNSDNKNLLFYK